MALVITSTQEAVLYQGIKILVWGDSGNGKTVFSATAPEGCTAIIDLEGGLLSVRHRNHLVFRCDTYEDVLEAFKKLTSPEYAYIQIVVLDSITELGEKVLTAAKKMFKDPRQAYGAMIEQTTVLVKAFRDLPRRHVIFTCKADSIKDDMTGIIMHGPAMPGQKLGPQLPYLFDEVFYLGVQNVPAQAGAAPSQVRYIQTGRDQQRIAKDRSGMLDFYEPADATYILTKMLTPR